MQIAHKISNKCKGQSPEEIFWRLSYNGQTFTLIGNHYRLCAWGIHEPSLRIIDIGRNHNLVVMVRCHIIGLRDRNRIAPRIAPALNGPPITL